MTEKLEVDGFEIDIETLLDASKCCGSIGLDLARRTIVTETVINYLTPDSKKRFEEYQEQNNPCRVER